MKSREIENLFINYFISRGHKEFASSPLVPNDQSLLFTSAGMVQFKKFFLKHEKSIYKLAVSSQNCMRVGGKHNDFLEIGKSKNHHSFFKMLGNFSFFEYTKEQAFKISYDFVIDVLKLPKSRLKFTCHPSDHEAIDIIKKITNDNPVTLQENQWSAGEYGPFGYCAEMFYDINPSFDCDDVDNDKKWIEFWNIVFMSHINHPNGEVEKMEKICIDTGMGLERMTRIMQGVDNNYETDIFSDSIKYLYENGVSSVIDQRILSDHMRCLCHVIAEGNCPSPEKQGYIIRKIIRRAYAIAKKYNHKLSDLINNTFQYIDIKEIDNDKKFFIINIIKDEEKLYDQTILNCDKYFNVLIHDIYSKIINRISQNDKLNDKLNEINKIINANAISKISLNTLKNDLNNHIKDINITSEINKVISKYQCINGEKIFILYDTYGATKDIINEYLDTYNLNVDWNEFDKLLNQQRESSKKSSNFNNINNFNISSSRIMDITYNLENTQFIYDKYNCNGKVLEIIEYGNNQYDAVYGIVTDKTVVYSESGGQISDSGKILFNDIEYEIQKMEIINGVYIHLINELPGFIKGDFIDLFIDKHKRNLISCNHTAIHLLNFALRKLINPSIAQKGSFVGDDKLTFDFTLNHNLTDDEIYKIEELINNYIYESQDLSFDEMKFVNAVDAGVVYLKGEQYSDIVRTVRIKNDNSFDSFELCCGTHVRNTKDIMAFKILNIKSVASGIRRIEAVTNVRAITMLREVYNVSDKIAKSMSLDIYEIFNGFNKLKNDLTYTNKKNSNLMKIICDYEINYINGYSACFIEKKSSIYDSISISDLIPIIRKKTKNGNFVIGLYDNKKASIAISSFDDAYKISNGLNIQFQGSKKFLRADNVECDEKIIKILKDNIQK